MLNNHLFCEQCSNSYDHHQLFFLFHINTKNLPFFFLPTGLLSGKIKVYKVITCDYFPSNQYNVLLISHMACAPRRNHNTQVLYNMVALCRDNLGTDLQDM